LRSRRCSGGESTGLLQNPTLSARDWTDPSTTVYPDAAFEVFDPRFAKYNAGTTSLRRISTGGVWTEGPVWFGDMHRLIWSDIPRNQLVEYNPVYGEIRVFRDPSNYANGNTRDREGRLLSCEQGKRPAAAVYLATPMASTRRCG